MALKLIRMSTEKEIRIFPTERESKLINLFCFLGDLALQALRERPPSCFLPSLLQLPLNRFLFLLGIFSLPLAALSSQPQKADFKRLCYLIFI
jgi:hypothetical protein